MTPPLLAAALLTLAAAAPALAQAPPRLAGTVIAPGSRHALIDRGAGTETVGLDEAVGDWRVLSIEPGLVRLTGPAGTVVIEVGAGSAELVPVSWLNPCGRLHPGIAGTSGHDRQACRTALDRTGLR